MKKLVLTLIVAATVIGSVAAVATGAPFAKLVGKKTTAPTPEVVQYGTTGTPVTNVTPTPVSTTPAPITAAPAAAETKAPGLVAAQATGLTVAIVKKSIKKGRKLVVRDTLVFTGIAKLRRHAKVTLTDCDGSTTTLTVGRGTVSSLKNGTLSIRLSAHPIGIGGTAKGFDSSCMKVTKLSGVYA